MSVSAASADARSCRLLARLPGQPTRPIKLTAFRTKDQMHLRDLLEVGLIDETWKDRYPPELAARLQSLIDTPDG